MKQRICDIQVCVCVINVLHIFIFYLYLFDIHLNVKQFYTKGMKVKKYKNYFKKYNEGH